MSPSLSGPARIPRADFGSLRLLLASLIVLSIACNLTAIGKAVDTGDTFGEVVEQTNEEGKRMEREYPPGNEVPAGVQGAPVEPTFPPLPTVRPKTPPSLTGMSFPSELKGDGTPSGGWFTFTDTGGDCTRAVFSVVSATDFTGFEYDPREGLVSGDDYAGTSEFNIWCQGSQTVTLRITLYDQAGAGSNSLDFTFTCKE